MGSCISTDATTGEVGCCRGDRNKRNERKRKVMEALAAEAKSNELLSRIPGRMCFNGASSAACMFSQQGRKGTNQDAMVVWESFASRSDTIFCGVFDGHGPYGHLVARRVRDSLPTKLMSHWKARMRGEEDTGSGLEEDGWSECMNEQGGKKEPEMFIAWKESFLKAYDVMDKELRTHPAIDCFCSGTTAVTMLLQGQDLVIGNVGDSRAILGTRIDDNTLEAIQLTVDLKPNLPNEAERIKRCKGRVFALDDEPEVARVWLPHDDSPGLAMARAFGDFCLKDFGLIAVPEITYRRLTERDQFVVLATDGVWDVLSNKEVADIVASAPTKSTAARALVETAVRAWRLKYPTSKVDDCAVVCLYLKQAPPSSELKPEFCNGTSHAIPVTGKNGVSEEAAGADGDKRQGFPLQEEDSPALDRSNTIRTVQDVNKNTESFVSRPVEIVQEKSVERTPSRRSLAECLSTADDDEWSALEGVTRVNSLLNLPRFLVGDRRAGATKKRQ